MKQIKFLILVSLGFLLQLTASAQYTVDTSYTALQLAQSLVGNNVIISNVTATGAISSRGLFTDLSTNYYFHKGLILSSGSVNLPDSNYSPSSSKDFGNSGDLDLGAISGVITNDASVLEFDFTGASDTVIFRYVFASEEYPEYINSVNDAFALFVSGTGITGKKNVALIPNTSLPISINTVNNGNYNTGPCMHCQYFDRHDSVRGAFTYDGSTKILIAKIPVTALGIYHLKFVIADASDGIFDSAILIQDSSLAAPTGLRQYINGNPKVNELICAGDSLKLTATKAINYNWNTGEHTQSIYVKQAGNYFYSVINGSTQVTSAVFALTLDTSLSNCSSLSVANHIKLDQVLIYPNPASKNLFIESSDEKSQMLCARIYDLQGRLKIAKSFQSYAGKNKFEITLEDLTSGLYILQWQQGNNSFLKKFNVE